jgi:hypothetical protein
LRKLPKRFLDDFHGSAIGNAALLARLRDFETIDRVGIEGTTLAGQAMGAPKPQDGSVEIMRLFRLQRRSAIRARARQAIRSAPLFLRHRNHYEARSVN